MTPVGFWRPLLWLQQKVAGVEHFASYRCSRCSFKVKVRTRPADAQAHLNAVINDHLKRCA